MILISIANDVKQLIHVLSCASSRDDELRKPESAQEASVMLPANPKLLMTYDLCALWIAQT